MPATTRLTLELKPWFSNPIPQSGNLKKLLAAGAQVYSGGSVGGAALLNEGKADICVNWAGEHPWFFLRGLGTQIACRRGLRRGISMLMVCEVASCARPSATPQSRSSASCAFINMCVAYVCTRWTVQEWLGCAQLYISRHSYAGVWHCVCAQDTFGKVMLICWPMQCHERPILHCTDCAGTRLTSAMLCRRHASREEGRSIGLLLRE